MIYSTVFNPSILMLGTPFDSDAGKIGFLQQNVDGFASVVSTSKVNDNKPHHISFQYSGSSLRCYIDGILEAESTEINATSTQNTNPIIFGGVLENEFFGNCKYELDEFRIWNIALSDQQVKERVCKKIKETDLLIDNLQAYYKLDEDSGSIIKDYTTHNFVQWYVSEQLEEEAMARSLVDKLKLIGGDSGGIYIFDRDLEKFIPATNGVAESAGN